jgi:hypothetical protein
MKEWERKGIWGKGEKKKRYKRCMGQEEREQRDEDMTQIIPMNFNGCFTLV